MYHFLIANFYQEPSQKNVNISLVCLFIHVCCVCVVLCQEQEKGGEGEEEDKRVTVIETSTGKKLTGDQAPLKSELEQWLKDHLKSATIRTHMHEHSHTYTYCIYAEHAVHITNLCIPLTVMRLWTVMRSLVNQQPR